MSDYATGCRCPQCVQDKREDDAADEVARLREFAQGCLDDWPDVGMDGFDMQNLAVKHGLLAAHTVTAPCGEACNCIEYHGLDGFSDGVVCYRKTALLRGADVRANLDPTA